MDRCLRSRSASASRNGATENDLVVESEQMAVEIVGAHSEKPIQLDSEEVNEVMTVSEGENPISASQLQSMFATFMAAMRAENCKLASTLESKLNELQK